MPILHIYQVGHLALRDIVEAFPLFIFDVTNLQCKKKMSSLGPNLRPSLSYIMHLNVLTN